MGRGQSQCDRGFQAAGNGLRRRSGADSGHGGGQSDGIREAEKALKASAWSQSCECALTEYPARDLSILDLLPRGVSKGSALERLARRLGVARAETMAIGDNWNDVAMLEWAGQGVVMGNAATELRALARTRGWKQAPSNEDDGVAVVLEAALHGIEAHNSSLPVSMGDFVGDAGTSFVTIAAVLAAC